MVSCAVYKPRVLTNYIKFTYDHHTILQMKLVLISKNSLPVFSKEYLVLINACWMKISTEHSTYMTLYLLVQKSQS